VSISKMRSPLAAAAVCLALLALPQAASARPGHGAAFVQRSGQFVILHADGRDGSSTRQGVLVSARRHTPVRMPDDVWIDPGSRVRLQGSMQNGTLVLADSLTAVTRTRRSPLEADAAGLASAPSVQNTAVILVSFAGGGPTWTGAQNPTQPQATSLMFDPPGSGAGQRPDSLNAYYQEQSYGQIVFSGTVFGPVTIPGPSSACGMTSPNYPTEQDALYTWLDDAEQAVGINVNDAAYQHVIVALPTGVTCSDVSGAAGIAEVGGNHVWINGSFLVPVLAHELGHNLGLYHAGGLQCTTAGVRVPMGDSCTADAFEYKDPFDAMGQSDVGTGSMVLRQMNMEHKLALDLLPASAVQTVGATASYHVAPMETLTGSVELLRVPKPGGGNYFVEYRYPVSGGYFDNQSPAFSGVYIRTESPQPLGWPNGSDTVLVDMHPTTGPGSAAWADAKMDVGQVFNDPLRGIMIQNTAQDANGATLAITMPVDTQPPSSPGRLSAVVSGTDVALQWTPAADNFAIASYAVARDGATLGSTSTTTYGDSGLAPGATVTYAVTATDTTGNVGPAATVSVTLPDTLPPSAPANVTATVGRDGHVRVSWTAASDNVRVVSYRVLRNGTGIAQPNATAYDDAAARPGSGATVTYSVIAFDLVGNAGPPAAAPPVRAALLRKLGASHLKVSRRARGLVRVTGTVSDVKAVCRLRLSHSAWRGCKAKASGAFSANLRRKGAKWVTLSLRDELGRVRQQTLRVP
jgi:chitodextrinase